MATIRKVFDVALSADAAWDVFKDFTAVHTRLAPGFVTDTRGEGDARIVTFANGLVAREEFVAADDALRRLVYAARTEGLAHHNGAFEVAAHGAGARITWTADMLPHEAAERIGPMMEAGVAAMQAALSR